MNNRLVSILAALITIGANGMAQTVHNTIPIAGSVVNPCNGEVVVFTGTDHNSSSLTLDSAGGYTYLAHDNIHVVAYGDQGNTYVGNEQDNLKLNGKIGAVNTYVFSFSEISRGSAPNYVTHGVFHITVHPDGTSTSYIDNFSATCRR